VSWIEEYRRDIRRRRVSAPVDPGAIRSLVESFDPSRPLDPVEAVDRVARALAEHQVHTPHPRYFGLFNPAPSTMGIAADALVAAFNPQLASYGHSPVPVAIESYLVREVGKLFGIDGDAVEGTFTSGGAEANHTALLVALARRVDGYLDEGLAGTRRRPVLYVSCEAHHSFLKAARLCGLGAAAVREVGLDRSLRMDIGQLAAAIRADRHSGLDPFMIVATAGTTTAGIVDPIERAADVAHAQRLWLHVDAAWGGAAALVPELRPHLAGIERADSITFDAHKWLSVPMAAGMFLTRHRGALARTFRVKTGYMARGAASESAPDPYAASMQWSRRFIGLKVFLSLAVAGWDGYAGVLRHQVAMGERLRRALARTGWTIVNDTPLPVVCVTAPGRTDSFLKAVVRRVVDSGRAWLSVARLAGGRLVIRACITNYRTGPADVRELARALADARLQESEARRPPGSPRLPRGRWRQGSMQAAPGPVRADPRRAGRGRSPGRAAEAERAGASRRRAPEAGPAVRPAPPADA
jgi:glutamate/tyrosine decarboxylase-like PLP-dependent enzyme